MRRVLKWIGIFFGALIGLVIVGVGVSYVITGGQLGKTYKVKNEVVSIPSDDAGIERGKYLAESIAGCADCHGNDLGGKKVNDDFAFGRIWTRNLTSGKGGVGDKFRDRDWVRALRHGVTREGKPLIMMPANASYNLSNVDLGAIIAYVKSVPPVDRVPPDKKLGPLAYIMFATGNLPILVPAARYDHSASRPDAEPGVTKSYGKYLTAIGGCNDCHREDLAGGPIVGAPPGTPPAANITPAGAIGSWSAEDFIKTIRTGKTPAGHRMNAFMPWKFLGKLTDDDLTALFLHLKTVPEKVRAD